LRAGHVAGRIETTTRFGVNEPMQAAQNSNTTGILLALGGGVVLSLNDLAIKALSGA
jgi:hypothetical protein